MHGAGRFRSTLVRVDPHIPEIVAEPRLEEGARGTIQRLSGYGQHVLHDRGRDTLFCSFRSTQMALNHRWRRRFRRDLTGGSR